MTCTVLGIIVILFIMVWIRAFYGSIQAYRKGEMYLKDRKYIKSITFFDRSIHWYAPFNPYIRKSAKRLWDIGKDAERQGDTKLALIAYRTIRNGFYAANSFYQPGRDWIGKCDIKINELILQGSKSLEEPSGSGMKERFTLESQKYGSPNIFWTVILEFGFLGWVVSLIGFIMFMPKKGGEDRYFANSSVIYIGLTIVFFTLWIIGMMKA
ncbi:tol-pal system YbgF family protein [Thermodesulfobacteriota bacterium]